MNLYDFFTEGAGNDFILYFNGKPVATYTNVNDAEYQARQVKAKHPDLQYEIKKEVCTLTPVELKENLRNWFKEKWVRFGPDGKIRGSCARGDSSEGKPKCLPQAKAHALGKKGRKYAASKKRREDPNPERRGPAKNVATKKKTNEEGVAEGIETVYGKKYDVDPNKYYVWAWDGAVVLYGEYDNVEDAKMNLPKLEKKAIERLGPYVKDAFELSTGKDLLHRYGKKGVAEAKDDESVLYHFAEVLADELGYDADEVADSIVSEMTTPSGLEVYTFTDDDQTYYMGVLGRGKGSAIVSVSHAGGGQDNELEIYGPGENLKYVVKYGRTASTLHTPDNKVVAQAKPGQDENDLVGVALDMLWGRMQQRFMEQGVAEGSLNEFAPNSNDGGEEDILHRYAKMWWAGDEATQMQIERALAKMGWEIGEDEGSYDNGGVFVVRAGDINGDSYQSWPHEELVAEGVAEARDGDTNFGHTVTRGSWVVYNGSKVKRFKTHTGAKAYAEKNGGKVASSEFYADKIQKPDVAEGSDDPWGSQGRYVGDTGPAQVSTTVARVQLTPGDQVLYKPTEQRATIEAMSKDGTQARIHVATPMGGRTFNCKTSDLKSIGQSLEEKWSQKYKSSINCSHPKGFSQKAHCAGKKKHNESIEMESVCPDCGMCETHSDHKNLDEACWKGYHKEGMKTMFGKKYPNCVKNKKKNEDVGESAEIRSIQNYLNKKYRANLDVDGKMGPLTKKTIKKFMPKTDKQLAPEPNKTTRVQGKQIKNEQRMQCPECGGPMFSDLMLAEKQDACYHKVKSRYKVWPSAYASGALVQCRKKGAANWGNKSKNESLQREETVQYTDPKASGAPTPADWAKSRADFDKQYPTPQAYNQRQIELYNKKFPGVPAPTDLTGDSEENRQQQLKNLQTQTIKECAMTEEGAMCPVHGLYECPTGIMQEAVSGLELAEVLLNGFEQKYPDLFKTLDRKDVENTIMDAVEMAGDVDSMSDIDMMIDDLAMEFNEPDGPDQTIDTIKETKLYYNVVGTPDQQLRQDFRMRKDSRGWYLNEDVEIRHLMTAFRAFGEPTRL